MKKYSIENLSNLGQGVSKEGKNITFVAKTLPDETVAARIYKKKKHIAFAELVEVSEPSAKRIAAECEHYDKCSGCHYLHTDYDSELSFKRQALANYFRGLNVDEDAIEVVASPQRFEYRNRVQLHYRHKYLGFINPVDDEVLEIENCRMVSAPIKAEMQKLYSDKGWVKEHEGRGHVELYDKGDGVQTSWNESYAAGGFTQVNEAVNEQLCERVNSALVNNKPKVLLDLFSGNGNLSNAFTASQDVQGNSQRFMIDVFASNTQDGFIQMNLFDDDALQRFTSRTGLKKADCLLIDPPRKGFENLYLWVKKLKPKKLIYVSCDPATLARDLKKLECKFVVEKLVLLDMFPGTYHFETLVELKLKTG